MSRVVEKQVLAYPPFQMLFDGAPIPEVGSAVKDGDLYLNGRRVGTVLSLQWSAGMTPWVRYLESQR